MRSFFLLIPFFIIRFGFLALLNKDAVKRAAHFPQFIGKETIAYIIYQLSNIAVFVYLLLLKIESAPLLLFQSGLLFYVLGLIICVVSVINFAKPSETGINLNGLYRFSRNPMYLSYFIFFIGCALLTQSWVLFGLVVIFQFSTHWIILSEERWCVEKFGSEYKQYTERVGRYL